MPINKSCKNLRVPGNLLTSPLLFLTAALLVVFAASGGCAKVTKAPATPEARFAKITKGPFLLRVSQNQAALMWETDVEGFEKVSFGTAKQLKNHIAVKPEHVKYKIGKIGGARLKKTAFIYKA